MPGLAYSELPIVARVRREHAFLRTLFDALARARDARDLRTALWDIYLTFNAHLDMEEETLAPLFRAGPAPERATAMILEHNEQRRLLRELVEDVECDAYPLPHLRARAERLVACLREDMAKEEATLALPLANAV